MTGKRAQAYQKLVARLSPKSDMAQGIFRAYWVGGVICALGQRARTDVVEQLRNTAPFVRVIGDARRVSTITNAVYQGYHAALDI